MMASTLADNSSRTLPASGRKREQEIRLFASKRRYDCKRLQLALTVAALVAMFRFKSGVIPTLGACAAAGVALRLSGLA